MKLENEKNQKIIKHETKKKPFDFNKFTMDNNGEVMARKPMKIDLLAKEFYWTKPNIKSLCESNITRKTRQKTSSGMELSPRTDRKRTRNSVRMSTYIIYNPFINRNFNFGANQFSNIDAINQDKVPPAGSNYDIIFPNAGVKITENKMIKEGDKEFGKWFNKTSTYDYDKILNEFIPHLNKSILHNKLKSFDNSQDVAQTKGNNPNNSVATPLNPWWTNSNNNWDMSSSNINMQSRILNEPYWNMNWSLKNNNISLFLSNNNNNNITNLSISHHRYKSSSSYSSYNWDNTIKINSKLSGGCNINSSLRIAFDSLANWNEDLEWSHEDPNKKTNKQANWFKRNSNIIHKRTQTEGNDKIAKDMMTKFNGEILKKFNVWGKENNHNNKTEAALFLKPVKGNYLRELGSTIIGTKLPRGRQYWHFNNIKLDTPTTWYHKWVTKK